MEADWLPRAVRDPSWWVAVAAMVAAWVAAYFAYASTRIAKRDLALTQEQDARRQPRIVPYLADGFVVRETDRRLYVVSLVLSNPSDADNSVVLMELQVRYKTEKGVVVTLRVPHKSELAGCLPGRPDVLPLTSPLLLNAHGSRAGWATFEIGQSVLGDAEILDYRIVLTDVHRSTAEVTPGILRELADETAKDHD